MWPPSPRPSRSTCTGRASGSTGSVERATSRQRPSGSASKRARPVAKRVGWPGARGHDGQHRQRQDQQSGMHRQARRGDDSARGHPRRSLPRPTVRRRPCARRCGRGLWRWVSLCRSRPRCGAAPGRSATTPTDCRSRRCPATRRARPHAAAESARPARTARTAQSVGSGTDVALALTHPALVSTARPGLRTGRGVGSAQGGRNSLTPRRCTRPAPDSSFRARSSTPPAVRRSADAQRAWSAPRRSTACRRAAR